MDLIDVTDELITSMGDTRLVIELPPRRRGEPPRLEGKQILHFGERRSVQEWEAQLRTVLNKVRANRLMATQVNTCTVYGTDTMRLERFDQNRPWFGRYSD